MNVLSQNPYLLVHICCAPDATVVHEELKDQYRLIFYFYNPNIHPQDEYEKRRKEVQKLSQILKIPLICDEYDPENWHETTKGYECEPEKGARCELCYRIRLEKACETAERKMCNLFTTVLSVSPHKNAALINSIGSELVKGKTVDFLPADFKKKNGFKRSIELSKTYNLYRQNYCGCIYSKR
ncbi:MAG: epoxyqueuosine reductase QueH [Candidatus Ancaeobacter aquaticus]|nr:epoxyqueuosine reductase QueH [Candidatus Ancaeobacter aquaticus]